MMTCHVPSLTADLVKILFLNIGEVITRELGVMDIVMVSFCSSREDRTAKADLVQNPHWWWYVTGPGLGLGRDDV